MPICDLNGEAISARWLLAEVLDYAVPQDPSKLVRSKPLTETRDNRRDQAVVFVVRGTERDESDWVPGDDTAVQLTEVLAIITSPLPIHGHA